MPVGRDRIVGLLHPGAKGDARRSHGCAEVRVEEVAYATGALATHDSPTAAVVVSWRAGRPRTGRRAARPPRTKNRGIHRARDDPRRSTPPRAARPGRDRADQREMPRRA